MSKIGTVNIQNCKIGTNVVSKILIGTNTYWSNVPNSMPPFDLNQWYINSLGGGGTQSLSISNNKLVASSITYATNTHAVRITSDTLRKASHVSYNYTISANGYYIGSIVFIVEALVDGTWTEVARKTASAVSSYYVNVGTFTDTLDVNTTANQMRLKIDWSASSISENLSSSITFNNINFS